MYLLEDDSSPQNLEILMPQKHVLLVIWEFIGLAQLWLHKLQHFVF